MKLSGKRIDAFLAHPDPAVIAVLVYGPDTGLVSERLDQLARGVVADVRDPFRVVDIAAAKLREDPARLADEAAAIAMTGGRRVVRLRDAGDGTTAVLQSFLAHPRGDALILIEAGELGPRSSLRKLVEDAPNAATLPCYADDGRNLEGVIRETLQTRGLIAEPDALDWLTDHLGSDRLLTRSELEKLALYMGDGGGGAGRGGGGQQRRVRLADVLACIGDSSALALDELPIAVANGDHARAQTMLARLYAEGTQPIAVLRSLQRHFTRLHTVAAAMANGKAADQALAALKPPPHFRSLDAMRGQTQRWLLPQLAQALDVLLTAEIDCKTTGLPAREICGRVTLQLGRAAGRAR